MNIDELQLDKVRTLLQQAGFAFPEPQAGQAPPSSDVQYVQQLLDALCELSSRDPLTGLLNRRHFLLSLEREIDRVARSGEPALLLMVDIDHFKQVNDRYGHVAGDAAIKAVAQVLSECVRPMDTLARFGGEEFVAIFPNCPPSFASVVAERIRTRVEATTLQVPSRPDVRLALTVSCGGAFAPAWIRSSPQAWIERADAQLYLAKTGGRNRVCLEAQAGPNVSAEEKSLLFGWASEQGGMMNEAPSA